MPKDVSHYYTVKGFALFQFLCKIESDYLLKILQSTHVYDLSFVTLAQYL